MSDGERAARRWSVRQTWRAGSCDMVGSSWCCFVFFLELSKSAVFDTSAMRHPHTTGLNQDASEENNPAQMNTYETADDIEQQHPSTSSRNAAEDKASVR